uniref:Uncharacterized protein n=1 Tax=Acrobeloides nanus TaxID=290746 RepID=A0A914E6T2_9BILA
MLFSRIIHAMSKLSSIPNVAIDPSGTFKYILVKVTDPASKDSKLIVRGFERCAYHSDVLNEVKSIEASFACCFTTDKGIHSNKKDINILI